MKRLLDKFGKNLSVVGVEITGWRKIMRVELARFKDADLLGEKTSFLHLMVNLQVESRRALPRTLTYLNMLKWWVLFPVLVAAVIFYLRENYYV